MLSTPSVDPRKASEGTRQVAVARVAGALGVLFGLFLVALVTAGTISN